LGSHLLKTILLRSTDEIYLLLRKKNGQDILTRKDNLFEKMLYGPSVIKQRDLDRIHVIEGDLVKKDIGIRKSDLPELKDKINVIYNCAAIADFEWPIEEIRKINVQGTVNLLDTASDWYNSGCLKKVVHISTAYISGDYTDTFHENQTWVSQKFNNTYEQSKFEAEKAVSSYRNRGLPIDMFRPSIIMDSIPVNKKDRSFALRFFKMFITNDFSEIPADDTGTFNLIPVDITSEIIFLIANKDDLTANSNYHIVNPCSVKISTFLEIASRLSGFEKPKFISPEEFKNCSLSFVKKRLLEPFIPYLNQEKRFDMKNTADILKTQDIKIPEMTVQRLQDTFENCLSREIT